VLLAALWKEGDLRIHRADLGKVAVVGCLGIGGYQILWSLGLDWTYATNSALLFSLQPIFGALYVGITGGEPVGRKAMLGMALALAGTSLIILRPDVHLHLSPSTLKGDLVTALACLCFAVCFSAWAKPLLARYSPLRLVGYCMVGGSLVIWLVALVPAANLSWRAVGANAWWALAYAVVLSGVLGHVFWYEGIGRIGVTRTLVYQYMVPIWAVVFNHLFLGEPVCLQQAAGGALILWGVRRVMKA